MILLLFILAGIAGALVGEWLSREAPTCPGCGREDWCDRDKHGYNQLYRHCVWCGWCEYHKKYTGKEYHDEKAN